MHTAALVLLAVCRQGLGLRQAVSSDVNRPANREMHTAAFKMEHRHMNDLFSSLFAAVHPSNRNFHLRQGTAVLRASYHTYASNPPPIAQAPPRRGSSSCMPRPSRSLAMFVFALPRRDGNGGGGGGGDGGRSGERGDDFEEEFEEEERALQSNGGAREWSLDDGPFKLVLIVNMQLKMGKGKASACWIMFEHVGCLSPCV